MLAVDAANAPAIQTYTAVGFQAWQQRELHVKLPIIGTLRLNRLSTVGPRRREKFCRGAKVELRVFSDDFATRNSADRILRTNWPSPV